MIEQTRVSSDRVWQAWVRAHAAYGQGTLVSGSIGHMQSNNKKKIPYQITEVVPYKSFSILWKALFVRFVFTHSVTSTHYGAEIQYDFRIEGPFAWMVRWVIAPKIRANLSLVLKAFVQKLESS
jgi:hypothetical protein